MYKAFLKNKKRSGTSLPISFSACFLRKKFFTLYFINWTNFVARFPILLETLGNMRIEIICFSACGVINFEINHSFFIKPFLHIDKKSGQKCKISRMKKNKAFFIIFQGLSIAKNFLRPDSGSLKIYKGLVLADYHESCSSSFCGSLMNLMTDVSLNLSSPYKGKLIRL